LKSPPKLWPSLRQLRGHKKAEDIVVLDLRNSSSRITSLFARNFGTHLKRSREIESLRTITISAIAFKCRSEIPSNNEVILKLEILKI